MASSFVSSPQRQEYQEQQASTTSSAIHSINMISSSSANQEEADDAAKHRCHAIGSIIKTKYGEGKVAKYRAEDGIYIVELNNAITLYTPLSTDTTQNVNDSPPPALPNVASKDEVSTMELNVAYEALEKMRRLNLEMECFEHCVSVDYDKCITCLLQCQNVRFPRLQRLVDERQKAVKDHDQVVTNGESSLARIPTLQTSKSGKGETVSRSSNDTNASKTAIAVKKGARFPRLQKMMDVTARIDAENEKRASTVPRIQNFMNILAKNDNKNNMTTESKDRANTNTSPNFWGGSKSGIMENFTSKTAPPNSTTEATTTAPITMAYVFGGRSRNTTASPSSTPSSTNTEQYKKKRVVLPRIQKLMDNAQNAKTSPCLICASPSCSSHSSANFRKSNIILCLKCERLFELDFIVDCISTATELERGLHVDHMIDLYDRSLLLLRYSSQELGLENIALSLEQSKQQQNSVKLGSSGVGMVSGVLGVAAAATILTPAGPPLLIASLFFGGGATAVQTGSEAVNYFSEPNKLADRIIALHGMVLSILRVTSTLRDAMMHSHIQTEASAGGKMQPNVSRTGVMVGANIGRNFGAAAARTLRFARFAGGALSAAVLVLEANAIHGTLKQIQSGNPCDKAANLRKIARELEGLPSTESLDSECQQYLQTMATHNRHEEREEGDHFPIAVGIPLAVDVANTSNAPEVRDFLEKSATATSRGDIPDNTGTTSSGDRLRPLGVIIMDGDDENDQEHRSQIISASEEESSRPLSASAGHSSLRERIHRARQPARNHRPRSTNIDEMECSVDVDGLNPNLVV